MEAGVAPTSRARRRAQPLAARLVGAGDGGVAAVDLRDRHEHVRPGARARRPVREPIRIGDRRPGDDFAAARGDEDRCGGRSPRGVTAIATAAPAAATSAARTSGECQPAWVGRVEARAARPRRAGARTRGSTPGPRRRLRRSAGTSSPARLRLAGSSDQRPAATRAEAGTHEDGRPAGADRGASAPQATRALEERVDLARARLDRDELGAALDDQRLVEVVTPVHLERQPAELAQPILAEEQQRPALAAQVAGRGRSGLAREERHATRITAGSAAGGGCEPLAGRPPARSTRR